MKRYNPLRKALLTSLGALALSPVLLLAANPSKPVEEHGVLKSIDQPAHTLVITEHKNQEKKFQWNDQTKFRQQEKTVAADALKAGETLHFSYTPGGDTPLLNSVNILPAKAKQHSALHDHTAKANRAQS